MSIQALRARRSEKAKAARNLLDQNTTTWSEEVQGEVDAIYAEIEQIDAQIEREQRQLDLEAQMALAANDPDTPAAPAAAGGRTQRSEPHALIFDAYLRGGERAVNRLDEAVLAEYHRLVQAAQSTGVDSEGGYLVPRDFSGILLEKLKTFGGVRAVANVQRTESGRTIDWPTVDETAEEGELVGESAEAGDGDIVFGTTSIGAYKYSSKVVTVPIELIQDQAVGDLEGFINRALTTRLGRITNKHFTIGTGVNQPKGIVVASTEGKVGLAGQTTSVTYDDLVDLEHSVDPAYRREGPGWMFHDTTLKVLKKLKDQDGRPLWRPGITGGDPADVLGYGYTINQDMAQMAANAKSILFGDFSKYLVRDVMQVTLFRFTDSVYTKKGQVGFLAWMRADGDLIDASGEAIRHYKNAAA